MKRALLVGVAAVATLGVTGCQPYTGINSLPLPGTVGTAADSYQVKVQLRNADNLVANTPVFVNDINVGTTTLVTLENGWTPTLTLSIKDDVKLPANATAALAQTSLLGSKHVDLLVPENPQGQLQPGALIKEDRVKQFPQTEDLLAGVSTLLNGGGLQHFQTVTSELNRALGNGRDKDARELLTQLNTFTGGLDKQTGDIVFALKSLDRLGNAYAPRLDDLDQALKDLPRGFDALTDLEPQLSDMLNRLGDGAESIRPLAYEGSEHLTEVLDDLKRPLRAIGNVHTGSIPRALRLVPLVIFPLDIVPYAVRGDYVNLNSPVNLTLDSLDNQTLTGTPLSGTLYSIAEAARNGGNPVPSLPNVPGLPPGVPQLPIKSPLQDKSPPGNHGSKDLLDVLPKPALPKIGN